MRKAIFLFLFLFYTTSTFAGNGRMTRENYIILYQDDAIRDMKKTGVPASITLAQALLESDDGNSPLATEANNHFGVKCADWKGDTYYKDDETKNECFRKYNSVLESYDDHSDFLRSRSRYASLFQLDINDYKGWAKGLKKCGYATNPEYAERIIKIIEDNRLYELDHGNTIPVADSQPVASVNMEIAPEQPSQRMIIPTSDVINPYTTHKVFSNNNVSYIVAKANDTYKKIADEFEMGAWQIYKYNEVDENTPIKAGQKIYIKPKQRTGKQSVYVVGYGQTLHDIAQEQGIKLRLLRKWNNLDENAQVHTGQKLWLEKKKS